MESVEYKLEGSFHFRNLQILASIQASLSSLSLHYRWGLLFLFLDYNEANEIANIWFWFLDLYLQGLQILFK